MRQIGDQWRLDPSDIRNEREEMQKVLGKYIYTEENKTELKSYHQQVATDFVNVKCSTVCQPKKELSFQSCFNTCKYKLDSALSLNNQIKLEIEHTESTFKAAGRDFYLN